MSEERVYRRRKRARTEKWECHYCDHSFYTQADLRGHEKKHTTTYKSTSKKTCKRNVESKNGNKRWRCNVCKSTLSNKANLKRHCATVHGFVDAHGTRNVNSQIVTSADKESQKDVIKLMYVCACTVATANIDSAFEHAQLHHLEGYKPILKTCAICKFTYEALHFADHLPNHSDNELQPVNYTPSKLLNADWCDMFPKLSEAHIKTIKSTSIYEHTRKVKMNCDNDSGILLYQCNTCDLFVSPKEVEDHCNKENNCLENQSIDHICCDCEIFFYTSEALREHEKEHREGLGVDSFRIVSFNCKRDATVNRALRQLQKNLNKEGGSRGDEAVCPVEVPAIEIQQCNTKNKRIEILDECLLCCGNFIPLSDLKTHKETHRDNNVVEPEIPTAHNKINNVGYEKNQIIENEVAQEQNIMPTGKNHVRLEQTCEMPDKYGNISGDNSSLHTFEVFKRTDENNVEVNDSCGILQSNVARESVDNKRYIRNATNADSKITIPPRVRKIFGLDGNFSEEMKNELRHELQKLITKADVERKIQTLQNETVNNTANPTEEILDSNNIIEILVDSDEENEIHATKVEIKKEEPKSNPRPSSRDILSKMLPSNSCESDLIDAIEKARNKEKLDIEQIIEQTAHIRDILFSRD